MGVEHRLSLLELGQRNYAAYVGGYSVQMSLGFSNVSMIRQEARSRCGLDIHPSTTLSSLGRKKYITASTKSWSGLISRWEPSSVFLEGPFRGYSRLALRAITFAPVQASLSVPD